MEPKFLSDGSKKRPDPLGCMLGAYILLMSAATVILMIDGVIKFVWSLSQ